ncbi:MAG: hypothetical protein ACKVPJ_07070 [Chitinophagales bacterium]
MSQETTYILKEGHRHFFHLFPDEVEKVLNSGRGFDRSALAEL